MGLGVQFMSTVILSEDALNSARPSRRICGYWQLTTDYWHPS
jgi:hypothetical protein